MEQSGSISEEEADRGKGAPPVVASRASGRWRRWWLFPLLWTAFVLGTVTVLGWTDQPRDLRSVIAFLGTLLTIAVWISWFVLRSGFSRPVRGGVGAAAVALAMAFYFAVDLINDGDSRIVGWRFRWQPLPDQLLLVPDEPPATARITTSENDYPRFLGSGFWAEVTGISLATDWQAHPPVEIWRQPIGAGWSAFSIVGDHAFTQEQRGDNELLTCYELRTGRLVWSSATPVRFDPQEVFAGLGGPGPRATPTCYDGKVYTQGATGLISCVEAGSGTLLWSYDPQAKHEAEPLMWGQSGSPLVIGHLGLVVVNIGPRAIAESNTEAADYPGSLLALDVDTGELRWAAGEHVTSYASPVYVQLYGTGQILQVNEGFVTSHRAEDGQVLWEHPWPGSSSSNASCSQPVPLAAERVLLTKGYGVGATLLAISNEGGAFQAAPVWNPPIKPVLKTKLGNVVVRDGFAYAIDDVMLQCIELETGKSQWKKRRRPAIGHGQLMLIGETIVVISETGELLLVACEPAGYRELASLQALGEDEVTWNNPAFSRPYLLLRNARQAVCYQLAESVATEAAGE